MQPYKVIFVFHVKYYYLLLLKVSSFFLITTIESNVLIKELKTPLYTIINNIVSDKKVTLSTKMFVGMV